MLGPKIAALYGLKPHQLGFCGPQDKNRGFLLEYLRGKTNNKKRVRKILRSFEGAYPYYQLIAKSNNIRDSLNERVVKAYWIGNKLLEKVRISALREMIVRDFSRPGLLPRNVAIEKSRTIPEKSIPHHSFHVLVVGSVTGRIVLGGKLLDLCRIGWGKVIKISNLKSQISNLVIKYQPLVGKERLKLGKPTKKEVVWDKSLSPNIKKGDWVSFHWNQVTEVLSDEDRKNLEKYTRITLKNLQK